MRIYIYLTVGFLAMLVGEPARADCLDNAHITIVFGNGIGTTLDEAQYSLDKVVTPAILQALPATMDQSCISFALAYDSKFVDLNNQLSTTANFVSQVADAGVQQGIDFAANFWSYWYSPLQPPMWVQDLQRQFITQTTSIFQPDLLIHEEFYNSELALGHKVIVVAHSQGNLYVNQAYDALIPSGSSDLFHIVAVATPATSVAGSGPYFTLHGDIIELALGLPPNISNDPPSPCPTSPFVVSVACHSFDDSYIDVQKGDHTRSAIVNAVLSFSLTAPPTSTTLPATSVTSTSAVLNGNINSNGTAGCAGFELELSPNINNPANSAGAGVVAASNAVQNFQFNSTGLNPNTTYYYRMVFLPHCAGSAFQTGSFVALQTLSFIVTTLPATSVTSTSAVLNGNINSNGTAGCAGFELELSPNVNNPANSAGAGVVVASNAVQNFQFNSTGLNPNTTYYYRMVFLPNCAGSAFQTGSFLSSNTSP